MKKILCILFCLLPVLGGKAQTLYRDQVRIEKESITRNEDNNVLSIDMDIVMQENLKLSPIMSPPSLRSSNQMAAPRYYLPS